MAVIGGYKSPSWMPFRNSNRDMQFLEWQLYLTRKIAAVFGLSPQDLGMIWEVNRSSGEVQQENTDDRGIRPLLSLIHEYMTREIVWDESFGGSENNLAFRFTRLNLRDTLGAAQVQKIQLAGLPTRSVNEVRKEQGLEPLGAGFDRLIIHTDRRCASTFPSARKPLKSRPPVGGRPGAAPRRAARALRVCELMAADFHQGLPGAPTGLGRRSSPAPT
jgi:hypothetical protein